MDLTCRAFRAEWLSDPLGARALEHACADCDQWRHSVERQQRALASLARTVAPAALDQRVAEELAGDRSLRLGRVLSSLVRRAAPTALDQIVAERFLLPPRVGDEERGRQKAEVLRSLDVQPAPAVLERLLNEELEHPERHRAERFLGGLERLEAPAELGERVERRVRRRAVLRLVLGPLATLAAAGLVVWIVARRPGPQPSAYRFDVVQASSLDELDPLARSLMEGLGGLAASTGEAR